MNDVGILVFSGDSFGGVERRFARLAAHLPVTLYCTADASRVMERIGIPVPTARLETIDRPGAGRLARLWGLLSWIVRLRRSGMRHIHLAMNPGLVATIYSMFARWLPPYSISVVDTTFTTRAGVWERLLYRLSLANAKAVDCLSPSLVKVATRYARPDRVHTSPCSFTDYSQVRTVAERDIDIALVARRSVEKGHELLNAALSRLPNLSVVTQTDDPFGVLARAKIFVALQRYENYPSQSLLEAMASGCAVIATDVGDTRLLLDESCAVLIPLDAEVLAESIRMLLDDAPRRRVLGEAARSRVMARHTIERFAEYFMREIV